MFKCQKCNTQSEPNEKQHTIITDTRKKEYKNKSKSSTNVTYGWEIVSELKVCKTCAESYDHTNIIPTVINENDELLKKLL